ncbi:MAG: ATP-binding protein [Thermodesulfobacteriota bacterium]
MAEHLPEKTEGTDNLTVQRALLERPKISIRFRVAGSFFLLFILMSIITVAAVFFISQFRLKLQFLEKVGSYAFEVQQARRFEKNFFLYRTNLSDALANAQLAKTLLARSAPEMKSVVGEKKYRSMKENLEKYEDLLSVLSARMGDRPGEEGAELRQTEANLREYGVLLVADAEDMIDRERLAMHSMLNTSMMAAIGFLIIMFFFMMYMATIVISGILRPLGRFTQYADRIGSGDYSYITPVRKYRDEYSNLAIAINQMIRELKRRQDQLIQSAKMAAVGTLTSGIAHELNNPLNNIGLTIEALTDGFDDYTDDDKKRMLGQMYGQVERASSTVANLLDFTRKQQPAFTALDVGKIVASTLALVKNEITLSGVELDLKVQEGLPQVRGNPRNLQQVFLNLFLNSIQAMPDGGRLDVAVSWDEYQVRVKVSDTGPGIPAESLDKIFDPFFTTKEPGQGTGLGLFVSYGIIEKHGGRITVQSTVGEGTTFSVFLPVSSDKAEKAAPPAA